MNKIIINIIKLVVSITFQVFNISERGRTLFLLMGDAFAWVWGLPERGWAEYGDRVQYLHIGETKKAEFIGELFFKIPP